MTDHTPVLRIHIDGASRGNPGPAALAYVIESDGSPDVEGHASLGRTTNNVAEYTALVRALERAAQLGGKRLLVYSDSELLVRQMNGEYRVKSDDLRGLYEQARRLKRGFEAVTICHIPRAENQRADELCNQALDGEQPRSASAVRKLSSLSATDPRAEAAREEGVRCLQAAAISWAAGDANRPGPEALWEQLWSVLEDHGVLKRPRAR